MTDEIEIVHALPGHTNEVAPLFDAYRCWYGRKSDPAGARSFIRKRLTSNESEMFFARRSGRAVAFAQLYPVFSSVSMGRVWGLNDLYVTEPVRHEGVGTILLETAAEFARALGAVRIQLKTKHDNTVAQAACEALGWKQDSKFRHYSLNVSEYDG